MSGAGEKSINRHENFFDSLLGPIFALLFCVARNSFMKFLCNEVSNHLGYIFASFPKWADDGKGLQYAS